MLRKQLKCQEKKTKCKETRQPIENNVEIRCAHLSSATLRPHTLVVLCVDDCSSLLQSDCTISAVIHHFYPLSPCMLQIIKILYCLFFIPLLCFIFLVLFFVCCGCTLFCVVLSCCCNHANFPIVGP